VTALDLARRGYGMAGAPVRSARNIEYDLFARVTKKLQGSLQPGPGQITTRAAALHENLQLWAALAADVAQPGNSLPQSLRARLFYLYEFTAQHSRKVQADKAGVEVLIDINTAIMRGLRGEGGIA
jgi:flagellar protein FlaF